MMNGYRWGLLLISLGAVVLGAAALISYHAITEAFGAGPPYYARTTNMDKWSNPLAQLLATDAAAVLVSGLFLRCGLKKLRSIGRSGR